MNFVEYKESIEYEQSKIKKKGIKKRKKKKKNVNRLWLKLQILSNISINTWLVWEKNKGTKTDEISSVLVQSSLECGVLLFCVW